MVYLWIKINNGQKLRVVILTFLYRVKPEKSLEVIFTHPLFLTGNILYIALMSILTLRIPILDFLSTFYQTPQKGKALPGFHFIRPSGC